MASPLPPDGELLAVGLHPNGFETFYRRHVESVMGLCAYHRLDPQEAADATSETFLRALQSRDAYDDAKGSATAWLFGILGNVIHAQRRSSKRSALLQERLFGNRLQLSAQDTADYVELRTEVSAVLKALAGLPEDERRLLLDRQLDRMPYQDLAAELQLQPETARKRVSRTLANLRSSLREEDR